MKVMARTIMKAVPGKMAELMELEKKHMAIAGIRNIREVLPPRQWWG
jgi:hypothetical protein